AVILPETRRASAFVVAERIRSEIERSFKRRSFPGREAAVTVTGGISAYPEDGDTPDTLVTRADDALYQAKRGGKNRISVFYREKRRASRYSLGPRPVLVHLDGTGQTRETTCRALNISEGGLLLESDKPLRLGQSLEMRILSGTDGELNLQGEVVRLEEKLTVRRKKIYGAGVKFRFGRRSLPQGLTRFLRATTAASV
ncbi:MAG TPA: diguanylate cyclase, partial [Candidatus Polarisedimenticolia bacterium]|nr:diguanylate cyclase [Candidatus Polarisedimenticolia bacterium]